MSTKKQTGGYVVQRAGSDAGWMTRKDTADALSAPMTEQESEEHWNRLFASPKSQKFMKEMAAKAIEEDRAGLTEDLVIDKL